MLFTASGAGRNDGSDWSNAMPIEQLSAALRAAQPGTGLLIGFDPANGPVSIGKEQVRINVSGSDRDPIFLQAGAITGASGIAATADTPEAFFQSAKPWSLESFGRRASSYFALVDGASHLRISGFRIDGTSADGFFKFRGKDAAGTYQDIVLTGIEARNVGRVIESERGARLQNVLVADCRAVGIVRGFARFRHLSDSMFSNLDLDAAKMDAGGEDVCQLIAVTAGENLLFENIVLRNAIDQPPRLDFGSSPAFLRFRRVPDWLRSPASIERRGEEQAMTVYVIADIKVTDDSWIPEYAQAVLDIVHKHGGRYLARSANVKPLEGKPLDTTLIAILQFPGEEAVQAFASDPAYAPYAKMSKEGSDSRFQLIDDTNAAGTTPYLRKA